MKKFICIGVPYYIGNQVDGRDEVESIKNSGIAAEFGADWIDIQPDFSSGYDRITAVNRALAETIQSYPDHIPLVFAGDCCCCIGMMKGLERHSPAVLWYDSHGDFNTPETTPSNFAGGMPLAAMVGRGNDHWIQGVGLSPISESDIIISDVRNLDPEESEMLRSSEATIIEDVNDLMTVELPDKPLYIHFDGDVVDSAEMPALGYPEPDGPSIKETGATLKRVMKDANVVGVLYSLFDGSRPGADEALEAALYLTRQLKLD